MRRRLLIYSFLLHIGAQALTQNYVIKLGGISIGKLNATHVNKGPTDYYAITSDVSFNLLFKIRIHYKTIAVYKNNVLVESLVKSLVNGKQYSSKTIWNGERYKIDCNTHKYSYSDTSRTEPIKWSVSKLYFDKPKVEDEVFAETYGRISKLSDEGNNEFRFEIPNSKQIYRYSLNSELINVEMINSIKNFNVAKEK